MGYTFAELKLVVRHAAAGTESANFDEARIINTALRHVVDSHAWTWLSKRALLSIEAVAITTLERNTDVVTLTSTDHGLSVGDSIRVVGAVPDGFNGCFDIATVPTADTATYAQDGDDESATTEGSFITGHISLPSDFDGIESLQPRIGWYQTELVTLDQVQRDRQVQLGVIGPSYHAALGYATQASATAYPTVRLELWPTPAVASASCFSLYYRRRVEPLSVSTAVADIPYPCQALFQQACRAHAHMMVSPSSAETQPEWALYTSMLESYKAKDGLAQPTSGRLRSQLRYEPRTEFSINAPT